LVATNRDLVLLQAAYDELGRHPNRPVRADGEPWHAGADTGIDPATQALEEALVPNADASLPPTGSSNGQGTESIAHGEHFAKPTTTQPPAAEVHGGNGDGRKS
jgi:hypothetical protein